MNEVSRDFLFEAASAYYCNNTASHSAHHITGTARVFATDRMERAMTSLIAINLRLWYGVLGENRKTVRSALELVELNLTTERF
jgi:hypothetical protein